MVTELTVVIAKIMSISFLVTGLSALFNKNHYQKIVKDMFKNAGLTMVLGFITLIVGFLIVTYHNIWESSWAVLITITGWISLIKGVTLLVFPKFVEKFSKPVFKGTLGKVLPYTTIVIGLIFGYLGFLA